MCVLQFYRQLKTLGVHYANLKIFPMALPQHIVFIPDGNRRWAKKQGKPAFFGHEAGAKIADAIFNASLEKGIPYTTFWGCSIDNLTKRDPAEVAFLMQIFKSLCNRIADSKKLAEAGVRVRVLGQWKKLFSEGAALAVENVIEKTKHNTKCNLTLLFAYNGNEEMLSAIKKLTAEKLEITSENLKKCLYTSELPPVDLVVRTGGEPHFSNGFMMWDLQNAELYFTDKTWPEFTPEELDHALEFFNSSSRRLGA